MIDFGRSAALLALLVSAVGAPAWAQDDSAVERQRSKIEEKIQEKEERAEERGERLKREQQAMEEKDRQRELNVDGRVTKVSKLRNSVVVHDSKRDFDVTLKTDEQSQITLDGKEIKVDDVPPGADARASYFFDNKRDAFVIKSLEASSSGMGGSGALEREEEDMVYPPREPMDHQDPTREQMERNPAASPHHQD